MNLVFKTNHFFYKYHGFCITAIYIMNLVTIKIEFLYKEFRTDFQIFTPNKIHYRIATLFLKGGWLKCNEKFRNSSLKQKKSFNQKCLFHCCCQSNNIRRKKFIYEKRKFFEIFPLFFAQNWLNFLRCITNVFKFHLFSNFSVFWELIQTFKNLVQFSHNIFIFIIKHTFFKLFTDIMTLEISWAYFLTSLKLKTVLLFIHTRIYILAQ